MHVMGFPSHASIRGKIATGSHFFRILAEDVPNLLSEFAQPLNEHIRHVSGAISRILTQC